MSLSISIPKTGEQLPLDGLMTLARTAFGLGIGMLVGSPTVVTMFIGGLVALIWSRRSPRTSAIYLNPLASGLIAGEALTAVIVPVLVVTGLLRT